MYGMTNRRQQTGTTTATGGGQGFVYDQRIGNNPLPTGIQGTANRAYTRTPQSNELVENRLNGLLSQNNPYIQNARQRSAEQSNSRGLLNSSIAAGAGERAAIESALPIASQDASAFGAAAGQNQDALNQMAQLESQLASQRDIAGMQTGAQMSIAELNANSALQRQREQLAYSGEQQGLDRQHQLGMVGYNAQWSDWLSGNQSNRQLNNDMMSNLYNTQLGMTRDYSSFMNNTISNAFAYGMFNPEFMANPQQMRDLIGGIYSTSQPIFSNFFNSMFGGG